MSAAKEISLDAAMATLFSFTLERVQFNAVARSSEPQSGVMRLMTRRNESDGSART